jgi:hypothetical protein
VQEGKEMLRKDKTVYCRGAGRGQEVKEDGVMKGGEE